MKRLVTLVCAVLTALTLLATPAPARAAHPLPTAYQVESLGVPLQDVLLLGGVVAPSPDGTQDALWVASGGKPAHLSALDPLTGRLLAAYPLRHTGDEGYGEGGYAVTAAPDGTVYVGTYYDAHLYRLRQGPNAQLEDLGQFANERYIWRITADEQGRIYGGTYPGGKAFQYDPATGTYRDYGQLAPGLQYVRSVAWHAGTLYAGTQPNAAIFAIDAASGAKRQLPLPAGVPSTGWAVHDMNVHDGYLYARIGRSISTSTLYVYDIAAQAWTDSIANVVGLDVLSPDPAGRVYFTIGNRGVVSYSPLDKSIVTVVAGNPGNSRGIGWATIDDPAWPGETLVEGLMRGGMLLYNPSTGKSLRLQSEARGEPIGIWSLAAGPDKVFAGGYLNGGLGIHDLSTGRTTYNRFSQIESILPDGNDLWLGTYPDAKLWRGTVEPFAAQQVAGLTAQHQMRVPAVVDLGASVAFGTQGDATTTAGALAIVDKATNQVTVHEAPVPNQGVVALTRRDELVFGGSSVFGAYSTPTPTEAAGRVFAWDSLTGQTRWSAAPLPGQDAVTGVALDARGQLWALANGTLVAYRPANGKELARIELAPSTNAGTVRGDLGFDTTRKVLWALVQQRQLWRIDPASGEKTLVLERPMGRMVVHPSGDVYVSSDAELLRIKPA